MIPLLKAAVEEKLLLHKLDDETRRKVRRLYFNVSNRLQRDLDQLQDLIRAAVENGETINTRWLHREARARALVENLDSHLGTFADSAATVIGESQAEAVRLATDAAPRLTVAAIGPGPRNADAIIRGSFNRMNTAALEAMIGRARDGKHLGALLREVVPPTIRKVEDTLAYGVASGKSPREIGAEVAKAADLPRHRGELIARQETIGAYRDATSEAYKASPVVNGWDWMSAGDVRTCPVCLAKHGSHHSDDEALDSHLCCRCVQVATTKSWAELGFEGMDDNRQRIPPGDEIFNAMPGADQRKILGPARYAAIKRGDITLQDLTMPTHSEKWGEGLRQASLSEALENAERRRAAR